MRISRALVLATAIMASAPATAQNNSSSMLSEMARMMETVQRLKQALPDEVLTPEVATFIFRNLSSVDFVMRQLAPDAVAERCRITIDADADALMRDGRSVIEAITSGTTPDQSEIRRLRVAADALTAAIAASPCAAQIKQAIDRLKSWSGFPIRPQI